MSDVRDLPHSPTPWAVVGGLIEDEKGSPVCDLDCFHMPNNEYNAALIVESVNAMTANPSPIEQSKGSDDATS